ncbi:MAG: pilin [Tatlockia sp.]|nr:pilin [Tatlockia sp.]
MKQKGMTLIELMIVIAILGVLISIAVPAYQDHLTKARVAEGLFLAETAKLAVSETTMVIHSLPGSQAETGYRSPAPTKNVKSLTIGSQGVITISYTDPAGKGTLNLVPTLHESGELTWACNGGTLEKKYRPATCIG